jgi:hypothetical protein
MSAWPGLRTNASLRPRNCQSVREIFNALVDLDVFTIQDIPSQPRSAKDVLTAFSLILEWLWEEHGSDAV